MLLGCPTQNIQVIYIKRFLFYAIINYSRISANRHLSTCTIATFFRPGGQKIHALTLVLNLSLQRLLSSVPKVAVVERFNCIN